uniref:DNA-directed RNA polymerase III subunit RPC10 n=3 Tax=Meloidogyne TaxID=189290 RepID=A0A915P6N6_9BILA
MQCYTKGAIENLKIYSDFYAKATLPFFRKEDDPLYKKFVEAGRRRRRDTTEKKMLVFCPACGTLLTLGEGNHCNQFSCKSCSYVLPIVEKLSSKIYTKKKEEEKILGGAEMWENAQVTNERCPVCSHDKAYFQQIQTRSADEPMTIFYRCASCAHRWKE